MRLRISLLIWPLFLSALAAQDIQPGPLAWVFPGDNPDELPVAHGLPSLELSDGQKTVHEPGYVEYRVSVSAKGKAVAWSSASSSPWIETKHILLPSEFTPAKRSGLAVASEVALVYIANPAEAGTKLSNAIPRLLAVQPPVYPEGQKPSGSDDRRVHVRAEIDEHGVVTAATAPAEVEQAFAGAAAGAVRRWTFAPARREGRPVVAVLEVDVVFLRAPVHSLTETVTRPKNRVRVAAVYPAVLGRAGISGEVLMEFTVSVEGRVVDPWVVSSTNHGFEDSALDAVRQWRFHPAELDGRPVPFLASQIVQFSAGAGGHEDMNGFKITVPKSFPPGLPEELRFEVPPQLVYMESPVYPLEDLQAHRKGKVTLAYVVDSEGKVSEVTALPGATTPAMAAAAAAAVECFKFTPPGRKGKPCHALLRIDFEFSPDGNSGQVPVTEATKRILKQLEKPDGSIVIGLDLDRTPLPRARPRERTSSRKGRAVVECIVDRDGIPRVPKFVSASDPVLGYAAVQELANWRFQRPIAHGRYVDTVVRVEINF